MVNNCWSRNSWWRNPKERVTEGSFKRWYLGTLCIRDFTASLCITEPSRRAAASQALLRAITQHNTPAACGWGSRAVAPPARGTAEQLADGKRSWWGQLAESTAGSSSYEPVQRRGGGERPSGVAKFSLDHGGPFWLLRTEAERWHVKLIQHQPSSVSWDNSSTPDQVDYAMRSGGWLREEGRGRYFLCSPGQGCSWYVLREGSFVCRKLFLTQSVKSFSYLNSCVQNIFCQRGKISLS